MIKLQVYNLDINLPSGLRKIRFILTPKDKLNDNLFM